jgi:two-component system LytT family response regulator
LSVTVLIVDDEAPARRKLRAQLARQARVRIAGEAGSGPEAVDAIRALRPDLVFLDIQMPGMNGFEVIEAIGADAMPAVVFVTAYDEFALDAFEVAAVDYLLKPFTAERFEKALARALAAGAQRQTGREPVARLLHELLVRERRPPERLLVRDGERMLFVPTAEIVRLAADGNYVRIHTTSGRRELRETLAALEERLDAARFVRVHRSEILNLDFVAEIQKHVHGDLIAVLRNGEAVRVSRRFAAKLLGRTGRR